MSVGRRQLLSDEYSYTRIWKHTFKMKNVIYDRNIRLSAEQCVFTTSKRIFKDLSWHPNGGMEKRDWWNLYNFRRRASGMADRWILAFSARNSPILGCLIVAARLIQHDTLKPRCYLSSLVDRLRLRLGGRESFCRWLNDCSASFLCPWK